MCKRVGLWFGCNHRWIGWLYCEHTVPTAAFGLDCDKTLDSCRQQALDQKISFNTKWLLYCNWCCSPQCCQDSLRDSNYPNQDGIFSEYELCVDRHLKYCLPRFISKCWMTNVMRADMPPLERIEGKSLYIHKSSVRERVQDNLKIDRAIEQHEESILGGWPLQDWPFSRNEQYVCIKKELCRLHGLQFTEEDADPGFPGPRNLLPLEVAQRGLFIRSGVRLGLDPMSLSSTVLGSLSNPGLGPEPGPFVTGNTSDPPEESPRYQAWLQEISYVMNTSKFIETLSIKGVPTENPRLQLITFQAQCNDFSQRTQQLKNKFHELGLTPKTNPLFVMQHRDWQRILLTKSVECKEAAAKLT